MSVANQRFLYSVAVLNGFGTGIVASVVVVLAAERFGLLAAGMMMGFAAAGRLLPLLWFHIHPQSTVNRQSRAFSSLVVYMVASSVAVVAAAMYGPFFSVVALVVLSTSLNLGVSSMLNYHGGTRVVAVGPFSMVGAAAGATLGGAALLAGSWLVIIAGAGLVLQLGQIPALRRFGFRDDPPVAQVTQWLFVRQGLLLAVCCYGPLAGYSAYVVEVASKLWVGPAMIAYAGGASRPPHVPAGRV